MTMRTLGLVSLTALGMVALSATGAPQSAIGIDAAALAQNGPPDHSNAGGNGGGGGNSGGGNSGGGNSGGGNSGNAGNNGGGPPPWAGGNGGGPNGVQDAYNNAGNNAGGNGNGNGRGNQDFGDQVLVLDDSETEELVAGGWGANVNGDGEFRNHGHRVRTMVHIAQALGLPSHYGALQANFGTPQENGIADLLADQTMATDLVSYIDALDGGVDVDGLTDDEKAELLSTYQAAVDAGLIASVADGDTSGDVGDTTEELQAIVDALAGVEPADLDSYESGIAMELEQAIEDAKPGEGPEDDWATANLDVNGDGVVDELDLECANDSACAP